MSKQNPVNPDTAFLMAASAIRHDGKILYTEAKYNELMRTGICLLCLCYGLVPVELERGPDGLRWVSLRKEEGAKDLTWNEICAMPVRERDRKEAFQMVRDGKMAVLAKQIFE